MRDQKLQGTTEGVNYLLRKDILESASVSLFDSTFNFQNSK